MCGVSSGMMWLMLYNADAEDKVQWVDKTFPEHTWLTTMSWKPLLLWWSLLLQLFLLFFCVAAVVVAVAVICGCCYCFDCHCRCMGWIGTHWLRRFQPRRRLRSRTTTRTTSSGWSWIRLSCLRLPSTPSRAGAPAGPLPPAQVGLAILLSSSFFPSCIFCDVLLFLSCFCFCFCAASLIVSF